MVATRSALLAAALASTAAAFTPQGSVVGRARSAPWARSRALFSKDQAPSSDISEDMPVRSVNDLMIGA